MKIAWRTHGIWEQRVGLIADGNDRHQGSFSECTSHTEPSPWHKLTIKRVPRMHTAAHTQTNDCYKLTQIAASVSLLESHTPPRLGTVHTLARLPTPQMREWRERTERQPASIASRKTPTPGSTEANGWHNHTQNETRRCRRHKEKENKTKQNKRAVVGTSQGWCAAAGASHVQRAGRNRGQPVVGDFPPPSRIRQTPHHHYREMGL